MFKAVSICFLLIITSSCSNNKSQRTNYQLKKDVNQDIIDQPKIIQRTGTTPKFVVHTEEPIPIKRIMPEYPEHIRNAGIEGQVVIRAEVFENGSVGSVEVLQSLDSSPNGLDECAVKAVKQWKFIPAKMQGEPIAVWVTFPIGFIQ